MVSGLAHNFLSVGQLLPKRYSVIFHKDKCVITDDYIGDSVFGIPRMSNNMFLANLSKMERLNLTVNKRTASELWHRGLGI